ncbi:hypothetical protein C7382_10942 [Porphyromonas loveana]|uniref:Uncharacterized protein n=1 Tax=Porphyromonas loveana TaxID=1884669 RepID=A0A2U1FBD8_9PORP|nr:hypothetical protein C7382_10942 [Porphyromonas loveana]
MHDQILYIPIQGLAFQHLRIFMICSYLPHSYSNASGRSPLSIIHYLSMQIKRRPLSPLYIQEYFLLQYHSLVYLMKNVT